MSQKNYPNMSLAETKESSTFTKMRQVYWEAKQSFNKSLGQREDSCIVSSDSELDKRLELLQNADYYFNMFMSVLLDYRDALQKLSDSQKELGITLIEYSTKDSTAAGKVMYLSGKAISKSAQRQSLLKTSLINLFNEVQTFQFKATSDALQTVSRMEKIRRSYRSGLMWLKNESEDVDPDVDRRLKNFKKVQGHIKHLKVRFDGIKLETMQKIDLFLLSRSNLFSQTLIPFNKAFKKVCKQSVLYSEYALKNIPLYLSYNFVALKDLNQYSKLLQTALQLQMSENQTSKEQDEKKKYLMVRKSMNPLSNNILNGFDSETMKKNDLVANEMDSQSDILIDLNETPNSYNAWSTVTTKDSCSLKSSKYSDDLLSINFGNSNPPSSNEYSRGDFHSIQHSTYSTCERILHDFASRQTVNEETDKLQFWSLIQNFEKKSKQEKNNSYIKASTLIPTKVPSTVVSDSKWNDILDQFDPFTDENSKCKKKAKNFETC